METSKKDDNKRTGTKNITEISEKHLKRVPNGDSVPDKPATGGKQFVEDGDNSPADTNDETKTEVLKTRSTSGQ